MSWQLQYVLLSVLAWLILAPWTAPAFAAQKLYLAATIIAALFGGVLTGALVLAKRLRAVPVGWFFVGLALTAFYLVTNGGWVLRGAAFHSQPAQISPTSTSSAIPDLLDWARQMVSLQKGAVLLTTDNITFTDALQTRAPTQADCVRLGDFTNASVDLYNQLLKTRPPDDARADFSEFMVSYGKAADARRDYENYVCTGDHSYYEKYVQAVQEANLADQAAVSDFKNLLIRHAVSCDNSGNCH